VNKGTRQPGTVSALRRGIAVLHCFDNGARTLSNGEISSRTGVPKPTVTRLAATLVSLGLLRQDPESERYSLGAGVLAIANAFLASMDVRSHARPHMVQLAEAVGGSSVYLGTRAGLDMVLVETCRSNSSLVAVRLEVGARVPLATSSLGRAWLSSIGDAERSKVLAQLRERAGAGWPRLQEGIEAALREAKAHGYCSSLGTLHAEVNSIAVPLALPGGEHMALTCGGPAFSLTEQRLRTEVAPRLLTAASAIEREIGGSA
jgi:IclR family transcriptional regulator, positive regulator for flagellar biogenesis